MDDHTYQIGPTIPYVIVTQSHLNELHATSKVFQHQSQAYKWPPLEGYPMCFENNMSSKFNFDEFITFTRFDLTRVDHSSETTYQ